MSVIWYRSEEAESVSHNVYINDPGRDPIFSLHDFYELDRCIKWIKSNGFSQIVLEFNASLTKDALDVTDELTKGTGKSMMIRGENFSCCADDSVIEAKAGYALIHFGNTCLSPVKYLPVLYVFGKYKIDIQDATKTFRSLFTDVESSILILYEVSYSYAIGDFVRNLTDYKNVIVSELDIPGVSSESSMEKENLIQIKKCGRKFFVPKADDIKVFYIGFRNETLTSFMLCLNYGTFHNYNPLKKALEIINVNKHLKGRYLGIEKVKHAKEIGILLGVSGKSHLSIVQHLKELIEKAGKHYFQIYTKIERSPVIKPKIDIFVNVDCMESYLTESSQLIVLTPRELELALDEARTWTGDYITDFGKYYPDTTEFIKSSKEKGLDSDVSLASGEMFSLKLCSDVDVKPSASAVRATTDELKISTIHSQAADVASDEVQNDP